MQQWTRSSSAFAFSPWSLTDAETSCTQMEKETLSIVHTCTKFPNDIFGTPVTTYNDQKPLEDIFKKPLLSTPMRIQRTCLCFQWYDPTVKYRKGKDMELQLSENIPAINGLGCIFMLHFVSGLKWTELQELRETASPWGLLLARD